MIQKILGWRWLPHVLTGLAVVALVVLAKVALHQRDEARKLAESRQQTITQLEGRIRSDADLIKQRDTLIAAQNAGIEAISKQRAEDRVIYLKQYAAADERARDHDDRAAQIMALPNDQIDELAQCRASRTLLEQELTQ